MRRTTSLTALLLGATLLTPAGLANAMGETCRGEAATVVGTSDVVEGTDGRDVIVSGAASTIYAHGGDDLVCVAGTVTTLSVRVDAGTGDDVVDTTGSAVTAYVTLGAGADAFFGGAAADDVQTSGYAINSSARIPDTERDVIDTGGGLNRVASPNDGAANRDVLNGSSGDNYFFVEGPLATDGLIDGGTGGAALETRVAAGAFVVDAGAGTASLDGTDWMRWSRIGGITLGLGRVDLSYNGTPARDYLGAFSTSGAPSVTAELGGGDDLLRLSGYAPFGTTTIDAGSGRDSVEANGTTSVRADLRAGSLRWGDATGTLSDVENFSAYGTDVRLVGDDGANFLSVGGCDKRAVGGKGADTLERRGGEIDGPRATCDDKTGVSLDGGAGRDRLDGTSWSDVLRGGGGNDKLIGRQSHDTLLGGAGRDTAAGGTGRDRCTAEVEKSCEH